MSSNKYKTSGVLVVVWIILVVLLSILIYTYEQNLLLKFESENSILKTECAKLETNIDVTTGKINSIISLEKLDKIAKEKKFTAPTEKEIVIIKQ